jgi:hypothetical protein
MFSLDSSLTIEPPHFLKIMQSGIEIPNKNKKAGLVCFGEKAGNSNTNIYLY